ncbi:MAG: hypothetical protein ACR2HX_10015 [Pyrinomonadaceae bacterium]
MEHSRLVTLWAVALVIGINSSTVRAQKPAPTLATSPDGISSPPVTTTTKASVVKLIDPEVTQRRSIALGLLTSLAVEARSYRDEALRARVQARVADALWDHETDNARALFRRAWEAAEIVEIQDVATGTSAPGRLSNSRPVRPRTNLRAEILKLAAQRDHALGEEFLKRLTGTKKDDTARVIESSDSANALSPAERRERLRLAGEFLEADNIQRALQFADPALVEVTTPIVIFLLSLREKNAAAADQRFAALLTRAAVDPASDANTVSLLTTYAFTPSIRLAVSPTGFPSSAMSAPRAAPNLAPALRASFFRVAANILLRPFAQLDQSSAGRAGTYFIAARLFPLFQQHAPDLAPAISAQLTALGPEAAQPTLNAGSLSLNRGMTPGGTTSNNIEEELEDKLTRARGADERDRAYAIAAMRAAENGDPKARDFLDKIEDLQTRTGIRSFLDYSFIGGLLKKNDVDEVLRLVRKSELTPTLRASVLMRAAAIVAKTDRVRASELLGEALSEARRIDAATPERAYTLVALLSKFSEIDRVRTWELVGETVKAANALANFTGESGSTTWNLEGKFSIAMSIELASATDLSESFTAFAEDDFYQAINLGKNFTSEAARAVVTVAIARATLEEKRGKPSR